MRSFIDIPQELRDRIIEIAIDTQTIAPKDVETAGDYNELNDIKYRSWIKGQHVMYPSTQCASACQSLMLVNKSLNLQTRAVLDRLNPAFELDVMLVQEYQLWATWTSYVPVFVPNVDKVQVSFRILPTTQHGPGGYTDFQPDNGVPLDLFRQLYALFERSLRCGPTTAPIREEKGFRAIQTLVLDVITPTGITDEQYNLRMPRRYGSSPLENEEEGNILHVQHPKNWLRFIRTGMGILLEMYHDVMPTSCILYERLGKIQFSLDGEVKRTIDLAEALSTMEYSTQADDRYPKSRERWCKTLSDVYEKRKAAGLPCIPIVELAKKDEDVSIG